MIRLGRVRDRDAWLRVTGRALPPLTGLTVLLMLLGTGTTNAIEGALGSLGFDTDRAILIAALLVNLAVAAAATLPRGRTFAAPLIGVGAFIALFAPTFVQETQTALATVPTEGRFDAIGWVTTLAALLVVGILVAVAAMVLATAARSVIGSVLADIQAIRRGRARRRRLLRPAIVATGILVVLAALPVFGDLVNYDPAVRLTTGGPAPVGLISRAQDRLGPQTSSGPRYAEVAPSLVPGLESGVPIETSRPWMAWRPSGVGKIDSVSFPAPWVGGTSTTAAVEVYLPPGYPGAGRRYPVLYEAPWGSHDWTGGVHLADALDGLITRGLIPASIVVLVDQRGGPYPDSECINSTDGREWFEQYFTTTVVSYVDSHYQTIARAAARALFGFSYGGFCAPMLLFRHPDLFSSAIAFSGYFQAAIRSGETPTAWRPYHGDQALINATSPIHAVGGLPASVRASLFVELSSSPTEAFFGPQYLTFAGALEGGGITVALFPTPLGHSWAAVRAELAPVLEMLAARETRLGVFQT